MPLSNLNDVKYMSPSSGSHQKRQFKWEDKVGEEGKNHCMDEHISVYDNYTLTNFKCQIGFLYFKKNVEIWLYASVLLSGPEILLNKISPL